MININYHLPIFLNEINNNLNILPNGIYIDCTFGGGNHSRLILSKLSLNGHLYAIDRDPLVFKYLNKYYFKKKNFTFINGLFSNIQKYTDQYNLNGKINGIILDLGISNIQLFNNKRGFSYKINSNLDMRMDNTKGITAKEWINTANINEIIKVLKTYSQEKFSNSIAKNIINTRKKKIISTTYELNNLILKTIPINKQNRYHLHPSTRTFQAIRIHINNELNELKLCLEKLLSILQIKGKILIISFHSNETRIIKNILNNYKQNINILKSNNYLINKNIFLNKIYYLKLIKKILPSIKEIKKNPYSKSATMRIIEKKCL